MLLHSLITETLVLLIYLNTYIYIYSTMNSHLPLNSSAASVRMYVYYIYMTRKEGTKGHLSPPSSSSLSSI